MKAITYDRYGPVDVLQFEDIPTPEPEANEVLIRVRATAVTTADWRMRSLEMPGAMRIIGRLNVRHPRAPKQGAGNRYRR